MTKPDGRFLAALLLVFIASFSARSQVNVLTYHNNNQRTGENLNEAVLAPANVNQTTFGKLFTYSVDGHVYAQPLFVSGYYFPGRGVHNAAFVATQHNSVYAFDADTNGPPGGLLWHVNLGPSAATPSSDFGTRYGDYNNIVPEVGITGTPVIDLASGTLYVDAFTHEGSTYSHKLHALNIADGAERSFSPVIVAATIPGNGVGSANGVVIFEAKQQIQRSALTLAGGILYVAYAGYDDTNPYHGWIIGFNAANLQQLPNYVFNSTPNSTIAQFGPDAGEGGIWMGGGGLAVDVRTNLYFATGNGSFNAFNNSGGTEYGDSFIRLSTLGGLQVADYFTPYNQAFLAGNDLDLGSSGVTLLPDQPGPIPHLMIGSGKMGTLYLINRDMMTAGNNHYNNGGSSDAVLQTIDLGGGVFSTTTWFNNMVYVSGVGDVLAAFSLDNGVLSSSPVSTTSRTFPYPGVTASVSANGTSNGIVWALANGQPAILTAYDANDLSTEFYTSAQAANARDQLTNGVKFAVPTVANGKVYCGATYTLTVFGLLSGNSRPTPYQNWKLAHFGANANDPAIAGDTADPDGDGIINLLEYAHATDPNQPDAHSGVSGNIDSNHFQIQFPQNISATDLLLFAQVASTLGGIWSNLASYSAPGGWVTNTPGTTVSQRSPSGAPPEQKVTVTISDPAKVDSSPNGHRFFRVQVELQQ